MKIPRKPEYEVFASNFSLISVVESICRWSSYILINANSKTSQLYLTLPYKVRINNYVISKKVYLVQPWLLDALFALVKIVNNGKMQISDAEFFHLIYLYNQFDDKLAADEIKHAGEDALLCIFGMLGEQVKLQNFSESLLTFVREKYILDTISEKLLANKVSNIDVKCEFMQETGFTTNEMSSLLFLIYMFYIDGNYKFTIDDIVSSFDGGKKLVTFENVQKVLERYCIEFDDIKNSKFERQVFYTKPFIRINNVYYCSNAISLIGLFTNSTFWVMRNIYQNKKKSSLEFTNTFGIYFEEYVSEIFCNCLEQNQYRKINEDNRDKRADWYLKLGDVNFFIEQKSTIALLEAKQNHPNVDAIKKFLSGPINKALKQLSETEKAFPEYENPIKIVLLYEDYFNREISDEIFRLNTEIQDDGRYWFITVAEFEDLIYLYKINPKKAIEIITKKLNAEKEHTKTGRSIAYFFHQENIPHGYLIDSGIYDEQIKFLSEELKK